MKKFSSLLLVVLMILAMAVPAFAADLDPEELDYAEVEIDSVDGGVEGATSESEASFALPEIKVTLPTKHGFIINPYNLEDAGQIIGAEATITNESEVAVEVSLKSTSAAIEGTPKKLATLGKITDKTTSKMVELDLVVTPEEGKATLATGFDGKVNITGKNTATKLVTLNDTDGEATLTYEGKVVANPVDNPWTDADKITITSIYTFVPIVVVAP